MAFSATPKYDKNGRLISVQKPGVKRPSPQTAPKTGGLAARFEAGTQRPYTPQPVTNRPMASAAPSPVMWSPGGTNTAGPVGGPRDMSYSSGISPSGGPTGTGMGAVPIGGGVVQGPNGTMYSAAGTAGPQGTSVPGATTDLDKSLTGLAASFDPTLLNYVYAQPELILRQLMMNQGQKPDGANSGLYTATTPYVDALNAILPLAFAGGGPPDQSSGINWIGSQLQQGMQPGGQGIDFTQVLNALRSQTRDASSAAGQYFTRPGLDPIDQYNRLKDVVMGAANVGLPPQFADAMKGALSSAFNTYMGNFTSAGAPKDQNFLPYFLNSHNGYIRGY
jgi:hypothetical protein